jgi:creatinine amidohydrolase/Fe(II)-dependent formamide hydrolase-like protein
MLKPITEMRPREILAARDRTGIIFIPVSPAFEWHSYHLPVGTDAIIAEELSRLVAERVDGLYFPAMSFGIDNWRTPEQKARWGFPEEQPVFGMTFPALPLVSEYSEKEEMIKAVGNRFDSVRQSGFRFVFIINNHGGQGQAKALNEFAREYDSPECRLCYVQVQSLPLPKELGTGGHANLDNETAVLVGFRPELADMSELPEGELPVVEYGILHSQPIIEPEKNPRNTSLLGADQRRNHLVEELTKLVQAVVAGDPMTGNAGPDPY